MSKSLSFYRLVIYPKETRGISHPRHIRDKYRAWQGNVNSIAAGAGSSTPR